jgi:hypothetical protein
MGQVGEKLEQNGSSPIPVSLILAPVRDGALNFLFHGFQPALKLRLTVGGVSRHMNQQGHQVRP